MKNCVSRFLATAQDASVAKAKIGKISRLFFIVILITGCATYHPKPVSPTDTASSFEARTLNNPALRKFMEAHLAQEVCPWPPDTWDFTLLSLAALYYHPGLDEARARLNSAEAAVITAGARPNPSFTFTPELSTNPPGGTSPWIMGVSLDIPIETAGKRGYRISRAKYLAQAAGLNVTAAAWQVKYQLRQALLDLSAARQSGLLLGKQAQLMDDLVILFHKRQVAGEVSEVDVTSAQISLAQTRLQLQSARARETEAREKVASSIGLPGRALENLKISTEAVEQVPPLAAPPVTDLRRRALLGRPDVLAALAEYDAADSSVRLEIAKQYPEVNLGPGYQWDQGENKWILGFSVALPVLNRNEGPIAEAEARRGEAEASFVALQARIIGEIDQAAAAYDAATLNMATADGLLERQKRRLDSSVAMYRAGEIDHAALLMARLDYHSAELSRLSAMTDLQESRGRLEDALQYPFAAVKPSSAFPDPISEAQKDR